MFRKVIGVLAGYLVFALSAGAWFPLMGHPAHADAPLLFKLETLAYGLFFSVLAGYITRLIGKLYTLNFVLAGLMFLLAALSLVLSGGSHWTQLMTMLVFAPASLLGGRLIKREL